MKTTILLCLLLCVIGLSVTIHISDKKDSGPKWGEWLCWATSLKFPSCGTYGWSKSKQVAKDVTLTLCESECGGYECKIDYCEKLSRKPKIFPKK